MKFATTFLLSLLLIGFAPADEGKRLKQLDAYWAVVSKAVATGDFEAYKSTCHPSGVLVSGTKKTSYPLSKALARWKEGFEQTKSGEIKASVEFRFSNRFGDETTAHETGMFRYSSTDAEGKSTTAYIHLEALLLKEKGKWTVVMEYQKSKGTVAEWKALQE